VLGLGPNLFYNSPMESCVVICRSRKPKARKGKVLFINAVNEVTRERAQSFLTEAHQQRIVKAYRDFTEEPGFAHVATLEEIRSRDANLSLAQYVMNRPSVSDSTNGPTPVKDMVGGIEQWLESSRTLNDSLRELIG
jgi:type I restriction enzyme M protein